MKPWNFGQRITWIILGPAISLSLLVVGITLHRDMAELNRGYETLAQGLTQQLARASHLALVAGNRAELREIAHSVLATDAIAAGARIKPSDEQPAIEVEKTQPEHGRADRIAAYVSKQFGGYPLPMHYVSQIPPAGEGSPLDPFGTPRAAIGSATLTLSQNQHVVAAANIFYRTATVGLALFLVLIITGYSIAWFAALPLRRMRRRLFELADPEDDPGLYTHNGYADIEQSLAALGRRLNRSENRAREASEALQGQEQQLQQAREMASKAARVRADWVAGMSHELRAPLTAILGHTRLLASTDLGQDQREYLATVRKSADNLLRLIDDVLEWSGLEAGKARFDQIDFNLHETVEDTLTLLAPLAYEKDLELIHLIYKDVPVRLRGDPPRFQQIITNLVSNAIKFTEQGSVIVRIMQEHEDSEGVTLRISVADTGRGLSQDDQSRLFRMYERLDGESDTPGSGLGLAISQRLAEMMGGHITVDSAPGQGADFQCVLPLAKSLHRGQSWVPWAELRGRRITVMDAHATARLALCHQLESWQIEILETKSLAELRQQLRSDQVLSEAVVIGLRAAEADDPPLLELLAACQRRGLPVLTLVTSIDNTLHRHLENHGARTSLPKSSNRLWLYRELCEAMGVPTVSIETDPHTALNGVNALVVDNSEAARRYLTALLVQLGASVAQASNGEEGVTAWRKGGFSLVILDYQMPALDGPATARQLRALAPRTDLPVIIGVTADNSSQPRQSFLQSGADDCLVKPFGAEQLLQVIGRHSARLGRPGTDNPAADHDEYSVINDPDLCALLTRELPQQMQAVEQAVAAHNLDAARAEIHTLQGTAAFYGLQDLKQKARALESQLEANRAPGKSELIALNTALKQALDGLENRSTT